ncbi:MAG: hypothetical protein ASUL_07309 [Candidatus Aramenus sulfurataquae]|jgi:hypothetical protein|uniref:Uncharacterized protein n=2 Tax=Candidatus Aramenus sulfurataquae TaxID=1326980 RepID=W7KL88_9CREN|nr:MAG: hypothetical protein ASUL_07309 [Candidatus Aramenus sulfurataquae]MCL7343546.1 hypothetical protein [Candidatus Aramenus sulfurataquae]
MARKPVEGYFVKYMDVVWAVKGCFHPENFVVAVPHYYKGVKIKRLNDALSLVKEKFPHLLKYVEEIGFDVPLVPLEESEILDPFNARTEGVVKEFTELFHDVGVTGSHLYLGRGNDIDVLTFNRENYSKLVELRNANVITPLDEVEESEVESLDMGDFLKLKRKRYLEGKYKGVPYTFKIVDCVDFGKVKEVRDFEGKIVVERAIRPYTLPAVYSFKDYLLTSFRTRFTELSEGTVLYVKGKLLVREDFKDIDLDVSREVKVLETR